MEEALQNTREEVIRSQDEIVECGRPNKKAEFRKIWCKIGRG